MNLYREKDIYVNVHMWPDFPLDVQYAILPVSYEGVIGEDPLFAVNNDDCTRKRQTLESRLNCRTKVYSIKDYQYLKRYWGGSKLSEAQKGNQMQNVSNKLVHIVWDMTIGSPVDYSEDREEAVEKAKERAKTNASKTFLVLSPSAKVFQPVAVQVEDIK